MDTTTYLISAGVGILIGFIIIFVLNIISSVISFKKAKKSIKNLPKVSIMDSKSKICQDKHEWKDVKLKIQSQSIKNSKDPEETLVCMKCGMMAGTKYQLNEAGLEYLKLQIKIHEESEKVSKMQRESAKVRLTESFNKFLEENGPDITDEYLRKLFDYAIVSAKKIGDDVVKEHKVSPDLMDKLRKFSDDILK